MDVACRTPGGGGRELRHWGSQRENSLATGSRFRRKGKQEAASLSFTPDASRRFPVAQARALLPAVAEGRAGSARAGGNGQPEERRTARRVLEDDPAFGFPTSNRAPVKRGSPSGDRASPITRREKAIVYFWW